MTNNIIPLIPQRISREMKIPAGIVTDSQDDQTGLLNDRVDLREKTPAEVREKKSSKERHHVAKSEAEPKVALPEQNKTGTQKASTVPTYLVMEEPSAGLSESLRSGGGFFTQRINPGILNVGKAPQDSEKIEQVLGRPITEEGIARFYADSLPGLHGAATIKYMPERNEVFISFGVRNGEGEDVASSIHVFRRDKEGALELELGTIDVNPDYRGSGFVPSLISKDVGLLRGLSDHPQSRMILRAAGYTPGVESRQFGNYVWAKYGLFEFRKPECLGEIKEKYEGWIDKKAKDLSPDTVRSLKELSASWTHPLHVAEARIPGVKLPASLDGAPPVLCDLGKAYLLSEDAPAWYGQCFVNQPLSPEAQKGLETIEKKTNDGEEKRKIKNMEWKKALESSHDAQARLTALKEIGRDGGKRWLPRLKALFNDPEIGAAARTAAERIEGKRLKDDLIHIFMDKNLGELERGYALGDFDRLGGKLGSDSVRTLLPEIRPSLLRKVFSMVYGNKDKERELAIEAAGKMLDTLPPGGSFWPRAQAMDGARALIELKDPGALSVLQKLQTHQDQIIRKTADDCIATFTSGKPQGVATLPVGEYPPEAWS